MERIVDRITEGHRSTPNYGKSSVDHKGRALCSNNIVILGKAFQRSRIAWTKSIIKVGNDVTCSGKKSLTELRL